MKHDVITTILFLIALASTVVSEAMFVVFGQVTVRKLRKNPATRSLLGVEFLSGWDIVNASSALSRPDWLTRRLERGALRGLFADSQALRAHTTRFDRVLAAIVYWGLRISVGWVLACMVFAKFG